MDKNIVKALDFLAKPFGITIQRAKDAASLNRKLVAVSAMVVSKINSCDRRASDLPAEGVVFSKDRAPQLHALLCSYKDCVKKPGLLHLLYAASTNRHVEAYEQVINYHRAILATIEKQGDFRAQTISLLEKISAPVTFFLVDDIIFIRSVDFSIIDRLPCCRYVTSLRLAKHLNYCYTKKQGQPLPDLRQHESGLSVWQWNRGVFDWNYPLSLDGHFFDTGELRAMVNSISFKAPNSLENGLQEFNDVFLPRLGACFPESCIVNIPINKVQVENQNHAGNVHQDYLLEQWERGMQIDYKIYYNVLNESAHQELPIRFIKRV